jgi:crotonobetainyl-CoA:carnitine CoA-transferase CaiB-like acyl-CoA transferase
MGPLKDIKIFDLTRVLAGPHCTQILGDLGADIIKIERVEDGDDTRKFAPPFMKDQNGNDTNQSAYFSGTNRNKRSLTLDLSSSEGQAIAKELISKSDILVENFKVGTLKKYNLDYESLKEEFPSLIYCSITGFGQTGPYANRPAYDALVQAMGGVMSLTGDPEGEPMKVGVSIADLMAGMYATVSVLAALRHRDKTNEGQHLDISMLDAHVAWLANQGMNYLATGKNPERLGNQHPNILPYQVMPSKDGYFVLSVGNDATFERFCEVASCEYLLEDKKFAEAVQRVKNREEVTNKLNEITKMHETKWWLEKLEAKNIGCCAINTLEEVFSDPQVISREMVLDMEGTDEKKSPYKLIANPIRMKEGSITYRYPPPQHGEHTGELLKEYLNYSDEKINALKKSGII